MHNNKKDMHRQLEAVPLGYFITIRTYGTWLHGDSRGWVDKDHNEYGTSRRAPDASIQDQSQRRMRGSAFVLTADSASLVERTIREVCTHRRWLLCAINARTNHVHSVVSAAVSPERVMNDFKVWATRRLRENGFAGAAQTVWADHGSTPYLRTEAQLHGAIEYVRDWQGGPLQKSWDEVRQEIEANDGTRSVSEVEGS